ncbi:hypothetical protein WME76_41110 [Sorangium sp. So ce119]|uniref:hypothetical protein n=1 Tax=Sorangium sp. So ce119 TaxID=3133279 RepID=UPI003F5D6B9A
MLCAVGCTEVVTDIGAHGAASGSWGGGTGGGTAGGASTGGEAGTGGLENTGGEAGTGGLDAGSGGLENTGGDMGTGGAGEGPLPDPVPSRQTVTFEFHNASASPAGVQVSGSLCSGFEIWRVEGDETTLVNRDVDYTQAACSTYVDDLETGTYERVAPGATLPVVWDAREEVIYERTVACTIPESEVPSIVVPMGVAQPVAPGTYEAVFIVGPSAEECETEVVENRYSCLGSFTYDSIGLACSTGGRRISVRFELPETGDVRVPVEYTGD